jgi:hypothetical protein
MSTEALKDDWFDPPPPSRPVAFGSDLSPVPLHTRVSGDAARSSLAGAIAGVIGGVLALGLADWSASHARFVEHARLVLGQSSSLRLSTPGVTREWILLAALVGLLAGALFGRLTRRLFPVVPRVLFGMVLVPSLWTLVYAFVILRFVPGLALVAPFVPTVLGALVFGLCVALARPIRRRSSVIVEVVDPEERYEPATPLPPATATASFPLIRRRPDADAYPS